MGRCILILLINVLLLGSCHHGEMDEELQGEKDDCTKNRTAELCIKNNYATDIDVYLNETWQTSVRPGHKCCMVVSAGKHNMRFEEKSNHHFRHQWFKENVEIHACSVHEMVIAN